MEVGDSFKPVSGLTENYFTLPTAFLSAISKVKPAFFGNVRHLSIARYGN